MLQSEPVTAPVYFITAGMLPNQGAVLTRDRNKLADIITLHERHVRPGKQQMVLIGDKLCKNCVVLKGSCLNDQ